MKDRIIEELEYKLLINGCGELSPEEWDKLYYLYYAPNH